MALPQLKKNLYVTQLGDELLVYDGDHATAHCLSLLGLVVYRACEDGLEDQEVLHRLREAGAPEPEAVLEETLNQLATAGLLLESPATTFDRRRFLEAAGAALALPILASVLAPRPAQAVSCRLCTATLGVPNDCTTCGRFCVTIVGQLCTGTRICSFEYVLNTVVYQRDANCSGFHSAVDGDVGGNYACRSGLSVNVYNPNNTFFQDCKTARQTVIDAGGGGGNGANANEGMRYYCCLCDGTISDYSCG